MSAIKINQKFFFLVQIEKLFDFYILHDEKKYILNLVNVGQPNMLVSLFNQYIIYCSLFKYRVNYDLLR